MTVFAEMLQNLSLIGNVALAFTNVPLGHFQPSFGRSHPRSYACLTSSGNGSVRVSKDRPEWKVFA